MVANCLSPAPAEPEIPENQPSSSSVKEERGNPPSHRELSSASSSNMQEVPQEEPEVLHYASSRLQYGFIYSLFILIFEILVFCDFSVFSINPFPPKTPLAVHRSSGAHN